MNIRCDLYVKEADRAKLAGAGPVDLWMPKNFKCKPSGKPHSRELANGRVICAGCEHGPCLLPSGIGRDRELRIHKEPVSR